MTIQITTENHSIHFCWAADAEAPKTLITLAAGPPRTDSNTRHVLEIHAPGSQKASINFSSRELNTLRSLINAYYETIDYHQGNP